MQTNEALIKTKTGLKVSQEREGKGLQDCITTASVTLACPYHCFLGALALTLWTVQDKIPNLEVHP